MFTIIKRQATVWDNLLDPLEAIDWGFTTQERKKEKKGREHIVCRWAL